MGKRQHPRSHSRDSSSIGDFDDDVVDYIHVGTELPTEAQIRRQSRKLGPDGNPKDHPRDAFKGGFTAGYHGTAGSKDGWQPSAFVSSRSHRAERRTLRPEDYMDEQDLADIQASKRVSVNSQYGAGDSTSGTPAVWGSSGAQSGGVVGALAERISEELGVALRVSLRVGDRVMASMGWKPGQGIGPLTRPVDCAAADSHTKTLRLPPRPAAMVSCEQKLDKHGAGYGVDASVLALAPREHIEEQGALPALGTLFKRHAAKDTKKQPKSKSAKKKEKADRLKLSFGAFGDSDSEDGGDGDDDSIGIGTSRSTGTRKQSQLERLVGSSGNGSNSTRTLAQQPATRVGSMAHEEHACFDGQPPLPGFALIRTAELELKHYEGPAVPESFTGVHARRGSRWDVPPEAGPAGSSLGTSTGRLVTAHDRARLGVMEAPRQAADSASHGRYPGPHIGTDASASSATGLRESARVSQVLKPGSVMLSRFTTGSSAEASPAAGEEKTESPANTAAKRSKKSVKRTISAWTPSRLLCKRMGIQPPARALADKQDALSKKPQTGGTTSKASGRLRASDFIHWDTAVDGSGIPTVVADSSLSESQEAGASAKRPEMALFKSIFGGEE